MLQSYKNNVNYTNMEIIISNPPIIPFEITNLISGAYNDISSEIGVLLIVIYIYIYI
jgi:hypothetical protein